MKKLIVILFLVAAAAYLRYMKAPIHSPGLFKVQPFVFVQLGHHPWLHEVQKSIKHVADMIIKEEILQVNPSAESFPTFYLKQRNLVTLLYSFAFSEDIHKTVIELVKNSLTDYNKTLMPVYFSDHIDWFGKEGSDIVIRIVDSQNSLQDIREEILSNLKQNTKLYDLLHIAEANKFDFTPHESIGRIDISAIEKLSSKATVDAIKTRIARAMQEIIAQIKISNEIIPSQIEVYGNDFVTIATFHIK